MSQAPFSYSNPVTDIVEDFGSKKSAGEPDEGGRVWGGGHRAKGTGQRTQGT